MHDLTLARLRPHGHTPAEIRDALAAFQQERAACQQRVDTAHRDRTAALIAGMGWQVRENDTVLRAAADDMEMMAAMAPALQAKLAAAEAIEARAHAHVAEENAKAEAAVAKFAAALPSYAPAAKTVAEVAHLGEAAGEAVQRATALARSHGVQGPVVEMLGMVTGAPSGQAVPLAALVRLPAPDGAGLLFGSWGSEHQPVPAFRYGP